MLRFVEWIKAPPVCDLSISPGDRFLLYTDGLFEPENARGDSFGERKLGEVVRKQSVVPSGRVGGSAAFPRFATGNLIPHAHDDITLIVIDVV